MTLKRCVRFANPTKMEPGGPEGSVYEPAILMRWPVQGLESYFTPSRSSASADQRTGSWPTGTVTFDYGWKTVAIGVLVDGTVVVDAKLPDNKEHAMDALYLGDANYSIARSVGATPVR